MGMVDPASDLVKDGSAGGDVGGNIYGAVDLVEDASASGDVGDARSDDCGLGHACIQ